METIKLKMYQIENTILTGDRESLHEKADDLLLEAFLLVPESNFDDTFADNVKDIVASYQRAAQYFWYA